MGVGAQKPYIFYNLKWPQFKHELSYQFKNSTGFFYLLDSTNAIKILIQIFRSGEPPSPQQY